MKYLDNSAARPDYRRDTDLDCQRREVDRRAATLNKPGPAGDSITAEARKWFGKQRKKAEGKKGSARNRMAGA